MGILTQHMKTRQNLSPNHKWIQLAQGTHIALLRLVQVNWVVLQGRVQTNQQEGKFQCLVKIQR